jgi:hypothetical protein
VVQGSLMAFTLISTSFLSKRGFYLLRPHNVRLDGVGGVRRRRGKHQIEAETLACWKQLNPMCDFACDSEQDTIGRASILQRGHGRRALGLQLLFSPALDCEGWS